MSIEGLLSKCIILMLGLLMLLGKYGVLRCPRYCIAISKREMQQYALLCPCYHQRPLATEDRSLSRLAHLEYSK